MSFANGKSKPAPNSRVPSTRPFSRPSVRPAARGLRAGGAATMEHDAATFAGSSGSWTSGASTVSPTSGGGGHELPADIRPAPEARLGFDSGKVRVLEREADAVADRIMTMGEVAETPVTGNAESSIQAKSSTDSQPSAVSADTHSRINQRKGVGGRPLPGHVRDFMEPRFGTDFGRVRVHNDSSAASLARDLNARAFTVGRDIFFGRGHSTFHTPGARRLLAHELTHTLQQSSESTGATIQRSSLGDLWTDTKELAKGVNEGAGKLWNQAKEGIGEVADRVHAGAKGIQCRAGLISPPTDEWMTNKRIDKLASHTGSYMRKGENGAGVELVQKTLHYWGCKKKGTDLLPIFGADRDYGNETKEAVKEFQRDHDLADDGTVGWNTFDRLDAVARGRTEHPGGATDDNVEHYLIEGADFFKHRDGTSNQFGYCEGEDRGGQDDGDGYDPRYWREVSSTKNGEEIGYIEATTTPWVAMNMLVRHFRDHVPKPGGKRGEQTMWKFDCIEAAHLNIVYTDWQIQERDDFNKRYAPLRFGIDVIESSGAWRGGVIWQMNPGEKIFTYGGEDQHRVYLDTHGRTMRDLAAEADIATRVVFHHPAALEQCQKDSTSDACNIEYENTVKAGREVFNGYPYGPIRSYDGLLDQMAKEFPGAYDDVPHSDADIAEARKKIFIITILLRDESAQGYLDRLDS